MLRPERRLRPIKPGEKFKPGIHIDRRVGTPRIQRGSGSPKQIRPVDAIFMLQMHPVEFKKFAKAHGQSEEKFRQMLQNVLHQK